MVSRFWLRLGKVGLLLLIAYLLFAYVLLITIIIRRELIILDANEVISVFNTRNGPCTLEGQVRNVFGDPVPHAVIVIGKQLVQADNLGSFSVDNLESGRYNLEIFAGNYEKYTREIQLENGLNNPPIKYDTGLWPQVFLVDFHIFYKTYNEILGILGFANGTTEPIYISRAVLCDPRGEEVIDLLAAGGFEYYADLSTKVEIVEVPLTALKWAGRMVQNGEFAPVQGSFRPGLYTLEVYYGFENEHQTGQYRIFKITDHLDLDNDWNPHLP